MQWANHGEGEGYQQPKTFRNGSSKVSVSVECWLVSLYFLGDEPIPYIELVLIEPWSGQLLIVLIECIREAFKEKKKKR